jgi:hypothetical protein
MFFLMRNPGRACSAPLQGKRKGESAKRKIDFAIQRRQRDRREFLNCPEGDCPPIVFVHPKASWFAWNAASGNNARMKYASPLREREIRITESEPGGADNRCAPNADERK